ncbi:MlaD family protein [Oleiharenicola lentus]|uniref:MlaD family protein n=1 Tax=Oleiharenicola lentus TaxID=2508720 RepID=UPI003F664D96
MKTKISPAAVGMFVLGALLLFIVGFLSFGGSNIFSKPARFVIYFDESVSGLDPGAPIKFYGVRVGRVAAVSARFDETSRKALVQTICEINRNVVTDTNGKMIDLTDPQALQTLIDRGLRAKLNFTGITGLLFVELNIEDPKEYPALTRYAGETLPVVPAIPSPIAEVQASIVEIVANVKKVDFAGIAKDVKTLLANTNQKINELDLKGLGERVGLAADSVSGFIASPEVKQTIANLNGAIGDIRTTLGHIDGQVGPVGEELKTTLTAAQSALKSLETTATTTQRFVASQGDVGDELTQALRQLGDAAAALERLADTLERNPSSLIVGKKKPGTP